MPAMTDSIVAAARTGRKQGPLREWETLAVGGEDGLPESDARRLHAAAERAARRLRLPDAAVLRRTHRGLKAGQVVGVLSVPGLALEILPKIDGEDGAVRKALVHLLAAAWNLDRRVIEGELAALDTQRRDLLEILIRLFANRLLSAVRRGMPRRYLTHEEDLALLRGGLDVKRQFTHLAARPDRLACRYDELSPDTPLNRVLKAAVSRLAGCTRSATNARRLAELAACFELVRESTDPLREQVRLDRTNAAFHDLHRLARLFLTGDWQSTTRGRTAGVSLLFPMNDLFEAFVGRCLQRALGSHTVHLQCTGGHVLTTENGDSLFALRPDAVIGAPAARPVILDTKWKRLTPRARDDGKTLGVAPSDVYQMLAYARAWDARRLVLVYPWYEEMDEPPGLNRRWRVRGTDCRLDVATVDIGRPREAAETLRCICEYDGEKEWCSRAA